MTASQWLPTRRKKRTILEGTITIQWLPGAARWAETPLALRSLWLLLLASCAFQLWTDYGHNAASTSKNAILEGFAHFAVAYPPRPALDHCRKKLANLAPQGRPLARPCPGILLHASLFLLKLRGA